MPANNNSNKNKSLANNSADRDSSRYQAKGKRNSNSTHNATKKGLRTGLKGAANAFGGPVLGKAADLASKTKLGDKALNKGADALNRIPGIEKTMKNLDDKKLLDAANKVADGPIPSTNNNNKNQDNINNSQESGNSGDTERHSRPRMGLPGLFGGSRPDFLGRNKENQNEDSGEGSSSGGVDFVLSVQKKIAIAFILVFLLFFFLIIIFIVLLGGSGVVSNYDDALGVSSASGGELGDIDYETADEDAQDFFDRVADVKNSMQSQGKSFDPVYISAVFSVLNQNGAKLDYTDMTTGVITDIANAMFSGNSFNEETFRENLINDILPNYLPDDVDSDDYDSIVDEIFSYYDDYFSLIDASPSTCASLGSCVYEIKGFYTTRHGNIVSSMTISDLQVRLMQCSGRYGSGDWNLPLDGEELVPFEQYILGVAYQEIGPDAPDEAIKAQMVAARSFSLVRPTAMGNDNGKKLEQENGQWILQMSSCVADQVYCNPELGCSAMNDGEQYGTVRSGTNQAVKLKDPLPADHKMRTLANETMGEVLVNDQGNVVYSDYASKIQKQFESLANQGLNYKQILLQVYSNDGATDIDKMSCNTGSGTGCASSGTTGPYTGWKQTDANWASISLGNSSETIGSAGCLVTSISMLIAKSGAATTLGANFNPGTFVQAMNSSGGFSGANFVWNNVSAISNNFQFVSKMDISGQTREQKLQAITNLVNQGYYVVAEVKGDTGQHWVAIDNVEGSTVHMLDPGSQSSNMWEQYDWHNTSQLAYFRVV